MKDKKLFITEDVQSICKVIDPNIDTVSYHKTNSNGMVAINVLKTVIHN